MEAFLATLLQPLDRQEFTIFTHNERVAHLSAPGHLDGEAPVAERGDDQPAVRVRSIRLRMAPGAERDQTVEVEVRAPLGALDDMVNLEGAPVAGRSAPPAGAPQHHSLDPSVA